MSNYIERNSSFNPERFRTPGRIEKILTNRVEKKIVKPIKPEFSAGFNHSYLEARRNGFIPVIISNHQSHADGLPMIPIVDHLVDLEHDKEIPDPLTGFSIVIAKSMETNHQNGDVTHELSKLLPLLQKHNISPLSYVREKDKNEYKLKRNLREFIVQLMNRVKSGHGVILFPEATVEGGRKASGFIRKKINGMQSFDSGISADLYAFDRAIGMAGKKALYIPTGTHGGFHVFNPDNNHATLKARLTTITPITHQFISAKVGLPIQSDYMKEQIIKAGDEISRKTISDYLGRAVASQLRPEAQGTYRES